MFFPENKYTVGPLGAEVRALLVVSTENSSTWLASLLIRVRLVYLARPASLILQASNICVARPRASGQSHHIRVPESSCSPRVAVN